MRRRLFCRKEMHMATNVMRSNQQGESNLVPAFMTPWELLSRDARDFVIMVMAAVADLINPRLRDLLSGTVYRKVHNFLE